MDRHKKKGAGALGRPQKNGNVSGAAARSAAARRRALAARRRRARALRRRRILALLIMGFCLILLAVGLFFGVRGILKIAGQEGEISKENALSSECEAYRPVVEKLADNYDMGEYVDLILAVMMQESSGKLVDVMQSSECKFNERYPREPNGITDTEYSLQCGIQELRDNLQQAGCSGPEDLDRIKIALQAYNFGSDYLNYLSREGQTQWTEENAQAFAKYASKEKKRGEDDPYRDNAGPWDYGDQYYPEHVLRYYQ